MVLLSYMDHPNQYKFHAFRRKWGMQLVCHVPLYKDLFGLSSKKQTNTHTTVLLCVPHSKNCCLSSRCFSFALLCLRWGCSSVVWNVYVMHSGADWLPVYQVPGSCGSASPAIVIFSISTHAGWTPKKSLNCICACSLEGVGWGNQTPSRV
jgi:hypothetical protein